MNVGPNVDFFEEYALRWPYNVYRDGREFHYTYFLMQWALLIGSLFYLKIDQQWKISGLVS